MCIAYTSCTAKHQSKLQTAIKTTQKLALSLSRSNLLHLSVVGRDILSGLRLCACTNQLPYSYTKECWILTNRHLRGKSRPCNFNRRLSRPKTSASVPKQLLCRGRINVVTVSLRGAFYKPTSTYSSLARLWHRALSLSSTAFQSYSSCSRSVGCVLLSVNIIR